MKILTTGYEHIAQTFSIIMLTLLISCGGVDRENSSKNKIKYLTLKSSTDFKLTNQKDTICFIEGYLQEYQATSKGKGEGLQWFDFEILFSDNSRIPISKEVIIDKKYINQYVKLMGIVNNGPIHNKPCPPYCQNAILLKLQHIKTIELLK